jgi:hypothetical protein
MICDAFEKAKAAVGIQVNIGSENMFKMLVREELTQIQSHGARKMAHSCTEYGPLDRG